MTNEIATIDFGTGEIVDPADPVQQGRDAWARIKDNDRKLREDWLTLAAALDVGRQQFITETGGLNKKDFGQWCEREGFGDLDFRVRADALWVLDNQTSIIGLTDNRENHPTNIRKAYRRLIAQEKKEQQRESNRQKIKSSPNPEQLAGVYSTILIDPPWDWGDEGDQDQLGRARPDYNTLSFEDLKNLPVGELADDDAHIYLWITNRSLPKGFELLSEWGFRYITAITWVKPHYGMGNYFRGQTEHILFGVKGSLPLLRKDQGTVFHADRGPNGHSSKPVELYDIIESCSPGPYLEMFSRTDRHDWTHWGENSNAA
ncbi:MAG: MT-A70 family methyltransferase [Candidatus Thiodiazotropha sp.]